MNGLMLHAGGKKLKGRQELMEIETPESTSTHTIIPHHRVVEGIIEGLAYRNIDVIHDEYALAKDGQRMFGFLTLGLQKDGVSLMMGVRNSHDRSFSLAMVAGFKVFVCDNLSFMGDFEPMRLKHSAKLLSKLGDELTIAIDRTQRKFDTIHKDIDVWKNHSLTDANARALIYRAFIDGELNAPARLAQDVHKHYFEPPHEEFQPRNLWSLQNAFTEAFKELQPEPFVQANQSLAKFFPTPDSLRVIDTTAIVEQIVNPEQENPDGN